MRQVGRKALTGAIKGSAGGAAGAAAGAAKEAGKHLAKSPRVRRVVAAALIAPLVLVGLVLVSVTGTGSTTTRVLRAGEEARSGTPITGAVGWQKETGLGDQARSVADAADDAGVPEVLLAALVEPGRGPWPAETSGETAANATTVARSLAASRAATPSAGDTDMLIGVLECSDGTRVVTGQTCPSGQVADSASAAAARQVREFWVAAVMGMEGLPTPRTGGAAGAVDAPAAPDDLSGTPEEMIRTIATSTFALSGDSVTTEGSRVVVSTDSPLVLATTVVTRRDQIGVERVEAGGRTWSRSAGWTGLDEPDGEADPGAAHSVRVYVCGGQCQDEGEAISREAADAVYSRALTWLLGGGATGCSPSAPGGSVVGMELYTTGQTGDYGDRRFTLDETRAGYVSVIAAAVAERGMSQDDLAAALMVAAVESSLSNLASQAVPESKDYPNDGVSPGDLDSVGIFQQRAGWGSVKDRMDPAYSTGAFLDRLKEVRAAHPDFTLGELAQATQVSGYPERYAYWEESARAVAGTVGGTSCPTTGGAGWAYPLGTFAPASSSWTTARVNPVLGITRPHWGTDIPAPDRTPVLSATDGTVRQARCDGGGCTVIIDSTDGWRLRYLHLTTGSFKVGEGDTVTKGQQIALEGSTGNSTGPHLHLEASPIDLIGAAMWCAFDASWADRCPDPRKTFADHGVNLDTGQVTVPATSGGTSAALTWARTKVGGPYVWGGTGPVGYDCSGLAQAAYKQIGISLPRVASDQCAGGRRVSQDQAQAGDLACWGLGKNNAYHVALYDGAGGIVGAQTYSVGIAAVPLYSHDRLWFVTYRK